jgi:hypothetical protein
MPTVRAVSSGAHSNSRGWPVNKAVWTLDGNAMLCVVRDVRRGETREISQDDQFPVDPFEQDGKTLDSPAGN